jgi:small-conductance mechanosensitive channel
MTVEQFTALGISDELAEKAAAESKKELAGYVTKSKADEAETEIKNLKATIATNESSLEELKKSSGDSAAMKEQIGKLQEAAKEAETKHQAEMKEIRITNAIKLAIAGKVHDDDIAAGLIDKEKLVLGEDGKVVGLDEQVKALQASKAFLFKDATKSTEQAKGGSYKPDGGGSVTTSHAETIAKSLNNQATDNPYAKAWG